MNWAEIGRFLILAGTVLVVLGLVFVVGGRIPLGKLPGDLHFGNERFHVYIPLTTCILLSLLIMLVVNFFGRR